MKNVSPALIRFGVALTLALGAPVAASAVVIEINTDNVIATETMRGGDTATYFSLGQTFWIDMETSQVTISNPGEGSQGYTAGRLYEPDLYNAIDSDWLDSFDSPPTPKPLMGNAHSDTFVVGFGGTLGAFYDLRSSPLSTLSFGNTGRDFLSDMKTASVGAVLTYDANWQGLLNRGFLFGSPGFGLNRDRDLDSFVQVTVRDAIVLSTPPIVPLPLSGVLLATGLAGLAVARRGARPAQGLNT